MKYHHLLEQTVWCDVGKDSEFQRTVLCLRVAVRIGAVTPLHAETLGGLAHLGAAGNLASLGSGFHMEGQHIGRHTWLLPAPLSFRSGEDVTYQEGRILFLHSVSHPLHEGVRSELVLHTRLFFTPED